MDENLQYLQEYGFFFSGNHLKVNEIVEISYWEHLKPQFLWLSWQTGHSSKIIAGLCIFHQFIDTPNDFKVILFSLEELEV